MLKFVSSYNVLMFLVFSFGQSYLLLTNSKEISFWCCMNENNTLSDQLLLSEEYQKIIVEEGIALQVRHKCF